MDAKKDLRPSVKKDLKGKKTNVLYINKVDKYSKERFVYVSRGYDFLENISVVRAYIVIEFYEYLSGEKKIPEDKYKNPMAHPDKQIPFDRKKMELIKKLNKLEVPEHKRFLFL